MSLVPNDLLAALPRLRRYARFLIEDRALAEALVEETVTRAREMQYEPAPGSTSTVRLLSLLRRVYAEQFAPGRAGGEPSNGDARAPNPWPGSYVQSTASGSDDDGAGDLLAHLYRLPIEQREVLLLVAVERMGYEDIAALLGVPVATVFARLVQARDNLRTTASQGVAAPKSGG